ncbi:abnormal spindle-like microcephaly-associated protein homolog isoform X2 [Acropora millepora]|uniref:abnormal spindle-like microcephaly-associated protein homolog isoform X2 n=1 Tax=Acropora millepora TaxID=45264 RepID=UPI001CF5792F|nr:abnormal spindle-like microcephaly-associated protein homolog isoform X2 [Acropora millepora]
MMDSGSDLGHLTPRKENHPPINNGHSKRAQWYSPCKSVLRIPLSPESDVPTLHLTQFSKVPKISFGIVAVGSSKTEPFVVWNPHMINQTLEVVKCPTENGFFLELNGQEFDGKSITIGPKEEKFVSITWEPKEGGDFREIIRFRWGERFPEFQVIVFGNAVEPNNSKSTVKRKPIPRMAKKSTKTILQPSQVLNTCDPIAANGFECITTDFLETLEESVLDNKSEENVRRDTYVLNHARPQKNFISKQATSAQENVYSKLKPSTPKFSKLSTTGNAVRKTNKVVLSKKKLSPPSGGLNKRRKRKVKLKVAANGVAQRKLHLVKTPLKNNLPRHPMPFASKNMYYDERWFIKQEEGFTKWLNFILTPTDGCNGSAQVDFCKGNMALGSSKFQPLAPTKETLSFRAYTARRKMARLRRSSCLLYQSEPLGHIIRRIEAEVENGRVAIRPDKKMHADFGIKRQVVDMLLSYNPLWLRIGLETIYGEILPIQSNYDVTGLSRFLRDRLLNNPDIAEAFVHPQVPGLYREGYVEQLGKFTLKKFLLLVLFLDRAKLTRLIDHDPCLFNKEAAFKSNRSILISFSREYLKGEGDITKHLGFLGYSVTHTQKAIDEVDYAVSNIATDLRDGLRLTRVTELLTQDWQLSASLRVPAISRLQKIHNVDVFMEALKARSVPLEEIGIDARHIVDGHREKTLTLLWQIIFHFQVKVLLSEKLLKVEIAHLESSRQLRDQLNAAENWVIDDPSDFPSKRCDSSELFFKSDLLRLLFRWCKIVCRLYGMKIENFTVSFSDGRALCYLLNHYHPSLLPASFIKQQTSLTCNPGVNNVSDSEGDQDVALNSWITTLSPGSGTNKFLEELKANERENFRMVGEKVKELGGVPLMTKISDMSCTIPDEKVVITYVAYLCARLLDLREETRAARLIQMTWRRYHLKRRLHFKKALERVIVRVQARARATIYRRKFQTMKQSALLIQSLFRGHLVRQQLRARHEAAHCIQTRYLAYRRGRDVLERYTKLRETVKRLQSIVLIKQRERRAKQERAVLTLQAAWRGYTVRRRLNEQRAACSKIQAYFRGSFQRKRHLLLKEAASIIQKHWRSLIRGRKERQRFLRIKRCVIFLQSYYRGKRDRQLVRKIRAATAIQRYMRTRQARGKFQLLKQATVTIQAYTRGYQAQRKFAMMKNAARVLQDYFRAFLQGRRQRKRYDSEKRACVKVQSWLRCQIRRKEFLRKKNAAIRLQSHVRKSLAQRRYHALFASTLFVQKRFRALLCVKEARRNFQCIKLSVVKIQAYYRGFKCRGRFVQVKQATIILQSHSRRFLSRKKFLRFKYASNVIQTRYYALLQGRIQRLKYKHTLCCIVRLQAMVRGCIVRRHVHAQHKSATAIQALYRQYSYSKRYRKLRESAIVVQRRYRSVLVMRQHFVHLQRVKSSVRCIQAYYRGYRARQFYRMLKATVVLQSALRGWQVRKGLKRQQLAATTAQALIRGHMARKEYLSLRQASLALQSRYRAVLVARKARSNYLRVRNDTVKIQSFFRGFLARKHVQRLRSARKIQAVYRGYISRKSYNNTRSRVILIQAVVRGYLAKKRYSRLKKNTLMLQRRYRASVIGMCQYVRYHVLRGACIVLQAAWRGYLCRKKYQEMRKAAIVCQQRYRRMLVGRSQRRRFLAIKLAVIRLQACTRGWLDRKLLRKELAAMKIQITYKMHKARREFLDFKKAVVKMQARVRMIHEKQRFNRVKNSALVIQRRFRAGVLCKQHQLAYQFVRGAVITIQMVVRGYLARVKMRKMNNAAVKIQAFVRGFLTRNKYKAIKRATLTLQVRWRAWLLGRVVTRNYRALRSGAVTIQSTYRKFRTHRESKRHHAATKIQCTFRQYICRSKFLVQKSSAITIQTAFRRYSRQQFFLKLLRAVLAIQRQFRAQQKMKRATQHYTTQRKACIVIQRRVRGWLCRSQYQSIRAATIVMQQSRRACTRSRTLRHEYLQLKTATIFVQCHWRMLSTRSRYEKTRNAVIKIQAVFRMRKAAKFYKSLKAATLTIQRRYRANRLCKEQHEIHQATRRSAILIQAYIRGFQARKRVAKMIDEELKCKAAATAIQRCYRGYRSMKKTLIAYHITRGAIITIQAAWRKYEARTFFHKLRATIKVQAFYRASSQRRKFLKIRDTLCRLQAVVRRNQTRKRFEKMRETVITLQQWYRAQMAMKKTYREYQCLKHATIVIQSYFRRHQQRQEYLRERQKVIVVQSLLRMRLERTRFQQKRLAAIAIQRWYRSHIIGQAVRHRFRLMQFAAGTIQSFYRRWKARREAKKQKAAILIQSGVRGLIERRNYLRQRQLIIYLQAVVRAQRCYKKYHQVKNVTLFIQRRVRENMVAKNARREFLETKRAVVSLQSGYRGWKSRYLVCRLKAVLLIQRWFRAKMVARMARAEYQRIKNATLLIQAAYRGYCGRMMARKIRACQRAERLVQVKLFTSAVYFHLCAIKIQRCYRRARVVAVAKARLDAVVLVQCWWRAVLRRLWFIRLCSATVVLQKACRRKLDAKNESAAKIQALVRGHLTRNQLRLVNKSALRIQTFWRGYRVRRTVSSLKVKRVRRRIESANAAATEPMKLCNRTRSALDFLLKCKNISRIVGALTNLEVVTRLSEVCCQQVVENGALPVIFKVIKKCNRSLPHLEVIKYSLSILYNVAKFSSLYRTVYEESDSVDILIALLVNFRDKGIVFMKTCCLLVLLCRDESIAQEISVKKRSIQDIKSVLNITERNYKLEAKRSKIKSTAENTTCHLAPVTPRKHASHTVIRQGSVDVAQDPLQAVRLLVHRLGIASAAN